MSVNVNVNVNVVIDSKTTNMFSILIFVFMLTPVCKMQS